MINFTNMEANERFGFLDFYCMGKLVTQAVQQKDAFGNHETLWNALVRGIGEIALDDKHYDADVVVMCGSRVIAILENDDGDLFIYGKKVRGIMETDAGCIEFVQIGEGEKGVHSTVQEAFHFEKVAKT